MYRPFLKQHSFLNIKNSIIFILSTLSLVACGGSGGSGGANMGQVKFRSSNVASNDKALLQTDDANGASGLMSAASTSIRDNLMRIKADGSLTSVEFTYDTVNMNNEPITVTATLPIEKTKQLNERFVAMTFQQGAPINHGTIALLDKDTGEVFGLRGYSMDDMQVHGTNLYALTVNYHFADHQEVGNELVHIDLADPDLTVQYLTGHAGVTINSGIKTVFKSQTTSIFSPLSWLSFISQGPMDDPYGRPSFIVNENKGYILAVMGEGSERHIAMINEMGTYDCNRGDQIQDVAGGYNLGMIKTSNGNMFQVQVTNGNQMGIAGADNYERLVKVDPAMSNNCINTQDPSTIVQELTNGTYPSGSKRGNFPSIDGFIVTNTNYQLTTVERYFLASNGFLKTESDGSGGVQMSWTSLDLSDVPNFQEKSHLQYAFLMSGVATLDGDKVYYIKNNRTIKVQTLVGGSVASVFHTASADIKTFTVVDGVLFYSTATESFKVEAGQPAESMGPAQLKNAMIF